MSTHLYEVRRPVDLQDDVEYDLVTVKRARGGVVKRETKLGRDISVKTQFRVEAGDFLISKRQIVHGACGIVPPELHGATVSNEYAVLRGHPTIDLEYLKYLSHSIYFQQTCFHSSIGVHIEKMIFKTDKWLSWEFDLPPVLEQSHIANILSTWDRATATLDLLIVSNSTAKDLLAKLLLSGAKRFREFNDEWMLTPLRSLAELHYGSSPKGIEDASGPFPIVGTGGIIGKTSQSTYDGASIVIGRKGTIDNPQLIQGPFWAIDTTYYTSVKAGCHLEWLYQALRRIPFRKYNEASGVPSLSRETLYALQFSTPSTDEQQKIAAVLEAADSETIALQRRKGLLRAEQKSLMQQLLTGKRRVKLEELAA